LAPEGEAVPEAIQVDTIKAALPESLQDGLAVETVSTYQPTAQPTSPTSSPTTYRRRRSRTTTLPPADEVDLAKERHSVATVSLLAALGAAFL
jgi:hypothetical protein